MHKKIHLKVAGINNLGQGFGFSNQIIAPNFSGNQSSKSQSSLQLKNKKIFISKTASGDEIEAQIIQENSKFITASLSKIIQPSSQRKEPPCPYFKDCGGCQLQHLKALDYQDFKQKIIDDLLFHQQIFLSEKINWVFIGEGSRRKAVLQVDENHNLGFFKQDSKNLVKIAHCLVLETEISNLIAQLQNLLNQIAEANKTANNSSKLVNKKHQKSLLKKASKPLDNVFAINQIAITKFDNGIAIVLHSKNQPNLEINQLLINFARKDFEQNFGQNNIISLAYKIDDQCSLIYQAQAPQIYLGDIKIGLGADIFLQASRQAQEIIIDEINQVVEALAANGLVKIAEFYCGVGTYSFGILAKNKHNLAKVSGFEGSLKMVEWLNLNSSNNNLQPLLQGLVRDLVKNPVLSASLTNYDLAIINPPRNGALAQIEQLAKSGIKNIIYISCNPQSFITDAKILLNSGYQISKIKAIDQFIYSHHLELLAVFEKK